MDEPKYSWNFSLVLTRASPMPLVDCPKDGFFPPPMYVAFPRTSIRRCQRGKKKKEYFIRL